MYHLFTFTLVQVNTLVSGPYWNFGLSYSSQTADAYLSIKPLCRLHIVSYWLFIVNQLSHLVWVCFTLTYSSHWLPHYRLIYSLFGLVELAWVRTCPGILAWVHSYVGVLAWVCGSIGVLALACSCTGVHAQVCGWDGMCWNLWLCRHSHQKLQLRLYSYRNLRLVRRSYLSPWLRRHSLLSLQLL